MSDDARRYLLTWVCAALLLPVFYGLSVGPLIGLLEYGHQCKWIPKVEYEFFGGLLRLYAMPYHYAYLAMPEPMHGAMQKYIELFVS